MKKSLLLIHFIISTTFFYSSLEGYQISMNNIQTGISSTLNDDQSRIILLSGFLGAVLTKKYEIKFQQNYNGNLLNPHFAQLGDYWGIAGQFIILSSIDRKSDQFRYASNAMVANGLITYSIKYITSKMRPDMSNRRSFPSGHTSASFIAATVAHKVYGRQISSPAFLLAGLTGISRIHDNKHYLSDVIFGAALGITIGLGFSKEFQTERMQKIDDGGILIKNSYSINVSWPL